MKSIGVGLSVVLLLLLHSANSQLNVEYAEDNSTLNDVSFRQARRSSIVDSCVTSEGTSGTCMTRFNCMRQGGVAKGFCATYGVCCETNLGCNQISKKKRTIIKNPVQLPTGTCQYTIEAYSTNVCQLLIEFEKFEMNQPTLSTNNQLECSDYFEVGKFILCGINTGQHLYVPFNTAIGNPYILLTFNLPAAWPQSNWRLIVTQLECPAVKKRLSSFMPFVNQNSLQDLRTIFSTHNSDLDLLAPPGCDQYYRQPSGNIRSFNYNDGVGTLYMSNLNYVICMFPAPGSTTIEYTFMHFSLSQEVVGPNTNLDMYCKGSIYTGNRREDYLMIPQAMYNPNYQATYFCGTALASRQIVYASPPFIMYFVSDDKADASETGFNINYRIQTI